MASLLIDYTNIIQKNKRDMGNLNGKIHTELLPEGKGNIGLILVIPVDQFTNLKQSSNKIEYVNTREFVDSILWFYFILYDKKRNLCEFPTIVPIYEQIKLIVDLLMTELPEETMLWAGVFNISKGKDPNTNTVIDNYINVGFGNPYITDKSPSNNMYPKGLAFFKENIIESDDVSEVNDVKNESIYISRQYKSGNRCFVSAKIKNEDLSLLKSLTKPKATINKNGTMTQKEMSGSFNVTDVINENGRIVFELSVDQESVINGVEENVKAVRNRYNFHTHPEGCYKSHGVTNGWPSAQDYMGFIKLNGHTISHVVVTLEGLYAISYSQTWQYTKNKIPETFVMNKYNIDHKKDMTPYEYVNVVNRIKYKGEPVFFITYLKWEQAGDNFAAFFSRTGDNCLATEESVNFYKKYYNL